MPGVKRKTAAAPAVLDGAWERGLSDCVQALSWSSPGDCLAAASVDGTLAVFQGEKGTPLWKAKAHALGCSSLAWHPGGEILATGGQDGRIRIWGADGKDILNLAPEGKTWIEKVAWDPAGEHLAFACGRRLGLWHRESGSLSLSSPNASTLTDLAWNPAGGEVAVSCYGGARLFRYGSPDPVREYPWKGSSLSLAWSPDGRFLAAGQQDQEVHLWETASGKDMHMHGYPLKVRELSWSVAGRYLATGGGDTVTVWDCSGKGPSGTRPLNLEGHQDRITALAFHPVARSILASGGADARLALWDLERNRIVATAEGDGPVTGIAWKGPLIAVGDEEGRILVFKAPF